MNLRRGEANEKTKVKCHKEEMLEKNKVFPLSLICPKVFCGVNDLLIPLLITSVFVTCVTLT